MQRVCHYIRPCATSSIHLQSTREFLKICGCQSGCQRTTLASGAATYPNHQINCNNVDWTSKQSNSWTPHKIAIFTSFLKRTRQLSSLTLRHMSGAPWQQPRTAVPKPRQVAPKSEQELVVVDKAVLELLDQIYEAYSAQEVLEICEQCEDKFNEVHAARALWCLGQISERDQQEPSYADNLPAKIAGKEIVQMEGFRKLCSRVLRDSPHVDDTAFISSLEALCKLQVPESSTLVQTLLEQSKHRLNYFDCHNLSHFAYLLDRMPSSNPLVHALLDGIALRVPDVIDDATHIVEVVRLMKAVGKRLPTEEQRKLVNRLYAVMSVSPDVTISDAIQGLKALVGMRGHTKLCCEVAVTYLKEHIGDVKPNDLVGVLIALSQLYYHDKEFCEMVGDRITEESDSSVHARTWSTNQLAHICRVYAKFAHLNRTLLDVIACTVTQPNRHYTLPDLVYILHPFAKLNYLPPNSDQLLDFITNACNMAALDKEELWVCVAMATYLALCGQYPSKMVDFIVKELGQTTLVKNKDSAMVSNLRKLHQTLTVRQLQDVPSLKELQHLIDSIPDDIGQPRLSPKVSTLYKEAKVTTRKTLTTLLGEDGNVIENVNVGFGYIIDFQLDKGESRQAVVLRDGSCYASNMPHHALVSTKLMQQHLEASGYQVVWILVEDIRLTSEEEREAFISSRLGL